jgi:predicted CopG family antitoxin
MSDRSCSLHKRCTVLIREDVYERLRTKGRFGESFSRLIGRLLDELDEGKEGGKRT